MAWQKGGKGAWQKGGQGEWQGEWQKGGGDQWDQSWQWGQGWSAPIPPQGNRKGHLKGKETPGKGKGKEKGKENPGNGWGVLPGSNPTGSREEGDEDPGTDKGSAANKGKGKRKSRPAMSAEEKQKVNSQNKKRLMLQTTAVNEARSPGEFKDPKKSDGQFNFPAAHRLKRRSPCALKKNCFGLIKRWKDMRNEAVAKRRMNALYQSGSVNQYAPGSFVLRNAREEVVKKILEPLGLGVQKYPVVQNLETAEGKKRHCSGRCGPEGRACRIWLGMRSPACR